MDIKRVSRGDWVVVAGFLALLIGTSLSWYALVVSYPEETVHFGVSGWTSTAGWLSWLAGLAAVVMIVLSSGVIPRFHVDLRGKAPIIIMGLGGVALLLVLIGLVTKPSVDELGMYLQTHHANEVLARALAAGGYSVGTDKSAFAIGIFFSLLGAAAVAAGGFLKMGEPVGAAAPVAATAVVSNAVQTAKVAFSAARTAVKTQAGSPSGSPRAQTAAMPTVAPPTGAAASSAAPAGFCENSGTQFRSGAARFCAACGTDRTLD